MFAMRTLVFICFVAIFITCIEGKTKKVRDNMSKIIRIIDIVEKKKCKHHWDCDRNESCIKHRSN